MKPRLLLVDDEVSAMVSMVDQLADEGFEVETAIDPAHALQALEERRFDALVVDCVMATGHNFLMSKGAGLQLVEQVRSGSSALVKGNQNVPIVVLTALCDQGMLVELSSAAVQTVLQKPVSTGELAQTLRGLVRERSGESGP